MVEQDLCREESLGMDSGFVNPNFYRSGCRPSENGESGDVPVGRRHAFFKVFARVLGGPRLGHKDFHQLYY